MRFFAALLGTLGSLALSLAPAHADVWIQRDYGGQIGPYLYRFAQVRESGQRVIIDGQCFSACTLVLAVVPPSRICITPRANLGFHAAWLPDEDGRPVTSRGGTRLLWNFYPPRIRHWISRHGGLTARTIFLSGRELASMYRPCGGAVTAARSEGSRSRARPELSRAQIGPM